jgi:hypothetical protein
MISARTKSALAAAKRRGVKLGGDRGARLTAKARAAGRAARSECVTRQWNLAPTMNPEMKHATARKTFHTALLADPEATFGGAS